MAAKPTPASVLWAADSTWTSGPQNTEATKATPSNGVITQGCVANQAAPAGFYNYLFNYFDRVTRYVLDGAFTGDCTFADDVAVDGSLDVSGSVVLHGSGTITRATAATALVMEPMVGAAFPVGSAWWSNTDGSLVTDEISSVYRIPLRIPTGQTLTDVNSGVITSTGGTLAMKVYYSVVTLASGAVSTNPFGSTSTSSGTGWTSLNATGSVVATDLHRFWVEFSSNATAGTRTVPFLRASRSVSSYEG